MHGHNTPDYHKHKHLSVKNLGLILCNVRQLFRHVADAAKTEDNSAC